MQSWILVLALAALTLNAALALPVTPKESEESTASDDQLINMLDARSLETEAESSEYVRKRRSTDEDVSVSSPEDTKEETSAKDHKDNKDNKSKSSESGSSEEKAMKPAARRRRSTEVDDILQELLDEAANTDELQTDDYATGCEVHEENSEEVNNETFIE